MGPLRTFRQLTLLIACLAGGTGHAAEIRVTLFGQPCLLKGPFNEATLKTIHAISPEQVYPTHPTFGSLEETRQAIANLKASVNAPSALDRYREKLAKRLDAQMAFLNTADFIHKKKAPSTSMSELSRYMQGGKSEFEALAKKAASGELFDFYNSRIEPNPEEEFHKAIRRLNIQYACSFEENDGKGAESDSSDSD